jgi:hypothetical protein
MTRAELNASIDAIFDDNRPDNSLAPAMEGAELKKVADYVDQEVEANSGGMQVVKTEKTTITSAQILNWHNVPIKIITGETGKIKTLLSYIMTYTYGTTTYTLTGTGRLSILYGSYGEVGFIQQPFVGVDYSNKWHYFNLSSMGEISYYSGEEDINVQLSSGNYNAGDGGIVIYATYVETTL